MTRPPSSFPWSNIEAEGKYRAWEANYLKQSQAFSTCTFVSEYGKRSNHPVIERIMDYHDFSTLGERPLA